VGLKGAAFSTKHGDASTYGAQRAARVENAGAFWLFELQIS